MNVIVDLIETAVGVIEICRAIRSGTRTLSKWAEERIRPVISLCTAAGSGAFLYFVAGNFSGKSVRHLARLTRCMRIPGAGHLLAHMPKGFFPAVCILHALVLLPLCAAAAYAWEQLYGEKKGNRKRNFCDICGCALFTSCLAPAVFAGSSYGLPKSALLNIEQCLPASEGCWTFIFGAIFCCLALERTDFRHRRRKRGKAENAG